MYKKVSLFSVFILVLIVLAACSTPEATADASSDNPFNSKDTSIIIDSETGCEYVRMVKLIGNAGAGGITPRLDADGEPLCLAENQSK